MNPKARGVRWLNAEAAAVHLGFADAQGRPKMRAFYSWRQRATRPPKTHWLAGRMRFREVDLDACVDVVAPESARPLRVIRGGQR